MYNINNLTPGSKIMLIGQTNHSNKGHLCDAAFVCQSKGWRAVNPYTDFGAAPESYLDQYQYARNSFAELLSCKAVYMIQGWEHSPLAHLWASMAGALGLIFFSEENAQGLPDIRE